MGFRFRKSQKVGPFRINMSQKGIGWSVGVKGLRYTKKAGGGSRVTASIPGTGISYVTDSKKPTRKCQERLDEPEQKLLDYAATPAKEQPGCSASSGNSGNGGGKRPGHGCLWWIVAVLFWPISLSVWFWRSNAIASKKLKAVILALVWTVLLINSSGESEAEPPTASSVLPASVSSTLLEEGPPASSTLMDVSAASETVSSISPSEEESAESEASAAVEAGASADSETDSNSDSAAGAVVVPAPAPVAVETAPAESQPQSKSAPAASQASAASQEPEQQEVMVWITATGSKYHNKSNCGNTKNASQVPLERALALGLEPCKRCY